MADTTRFNYKPLVADSDEIRLIQILSSDDEGPRQIKLRLEHFKLCDMRNKFTAISYVWGTSRSENDVVWIDDRSLNLHQNIMAFLKHCLDHEVRLDAWLWIDAICINQEDLQERGQQVNLMGSLFRSAEFVFIWMPRMQVHADWVEKNAWSDLFEDAFINQCGRSYNIRPEGQAKIILNTVDWNERLNGGHREEFRPIHELATDEYWNRMWIVQECLLAQRLLLVVGGRLVDFSRLFFRSWSIGPRWMLDFLPQRTHRLAKQPFRKHVTFLKARDWFILMKGTSGHVCADPRDRIYGLIGLLDATTTSIMADYCKSATELLAHTYTYLRQAGYAMSLIELGDLAHALEVDIGDLLQPNLSASEQNLAFSLQQALSTTLVDVEVRADNFGYPANADRAVSIFDVNDLIHSDFDKSDYHQAHLPAVEPDRSSTSVLPSVVYCRFGGHSDYLVLEKSLDGNLRVYHISEDPRPGPYQASEHINFFEESYEQLQSVIPVTKTFADCVQEQLDQIKAEIKSHPLLSNFAPIYVLQIPLSICLELLGTLKSYERAHRNTAESFDNNEL